MTFPNPTKESLSVLLIALCEERTGLRPSPHALAECVEELLQELSCHYTAFSTKCSNETTKSCGEPSTPRKTSARGTSKPVETTSPEQVSSSPLLPSGLHSWR